MTFISQSMKDSINIGPEIGNSQVNSPPIKINQLQKKNSHFEKSSLVDRINNIPLQLGQTTSKFNPAGPSNNSSLEKNQKGKNLINAQNKQINKAV